jgi:hypothetical protein
MVAEKKNKKYFWLKLSEVHKEVKARRILFGMHQANFLDFVGLNMQSFRSAQEFNIQRPPYSHVNLRNCQATKANIVFRVAMKNKECLLTILIFI